MAARHEIGMKTPICKETTRVITHPRSSGRRLFFLTLSHALHIKRGPVTVFTATG